MLKETLKILFRRDLEKLRQEIDSYRDEKNLWRTDKEIPNSAGNLCLHLIGNLNTFIGAEIGKSGYVRDRDLEFSQKNTSKNGLLQKIDETIIVVGNALETLTDKSFDEEYSLIVFDEPMTTGFFWFIWRRILIIISDRSIITGGFWTIKKDQRNQDFRMDEVYISEETFDEKDFTKDSLPEGEYENCTFRNCDFSESDLSNVKFFDCEFLNCNLSLAKLIETAFRDVKFQDCKMLGLRFEDCNAFGLTFVFENCRLDHSSFHGTKIKAISFKNSQMREVDFSNCDLTAAMFENCDLARATFANTIIEKADFRTAFNYSIDAETNRIKKAKFSLPEIVGLLHKYDIEIEGQN